MSTGENKVLALFPGPIRSALKTIRRSYVGWIHRFFFPFWLAYQCLVHRRRAVVVWRLAALGDIICTFPLCREIRRRHPNRLLIYITQDRGYDRIVAMSRTVDLTYGVRCPYGEKAWVTQRTRWFGLIEHFYEPMTADERSGTGVAMHLVDNMAESCGITLTDRQPKLFVPPELIESTLKAHDLSAGIASGRLIVAINGGHSWPVKEWDAPKWQAVIDMLRNDYNALVLQFGLSYPPGVPDPYNEFTGVIRLIDRLSMLEFIAVVASCDLVVSIDSGPIHVAGAVGTPVVGIFGANGAEFRLPPETPGMGVASDVPCLNCQHRTPIEHWKTGCPYDIRCMRLLEPAPVIDAIKAMLARHPKRAAASGSGQVIQ